MTDRELIEAAARAAGIEHAMFWEAAPERGEPFVYASLAKGGYWRPLGDDGDTLRLATLLGIDVSFNWEHALCVYANECMESLPGNCGDRNAATRRAITRAAAEIGRARDGGEMG